MSTLSYQRFRFETTAAKSIKANSTFAPCRNRARGQPATCVPGQVVKELRLSYR